ncbi:ATP synthase complex subunit H [Rhizoctonia solani AG-3 Rhs1AP]|uniref:ATP synthase complex subunit H n=2 Tax=Rhizoctonia solani AG-3 TaxID=1086053 RepID=A0A074S2D7_9AGAM|nr:ATP synthase complex subunit H [Rhizoctonia solani AG-3 Rhs1AP]KEP51705.1 ATP synthase complex subunit H [Rhizoctonia solani 123E]
MSAIARQSFMACRHARFSTSAVARKDLVQDLYMRELKAYKAPVKAKDAHIGAVKSYTAPSAPSPPSAPTDLASELSKYDATEPTLADAPSTPSPAAQAQGEVGSADAFLAFLEQDVPKAEAHH